MPKPNVFIGTIVGLFILVCILVAMVAIAVMQVIRTISDIGPPIYIIGGAVFLAAVLIVIMLTIIARRLKNLKQ